MTDRIKELVDLFLAWPLPKSVSSDLCVTDPKYPHPRSGTNLLTASEARQMFEYLFAKGTPEWTKELEAARVDLCKFWVMIADDVHEGGARYPELGRRALETEQALTLMADLLCPPTAPYPQLSGTEQTMHAAWRKRAEEAEAELAAMRKVVEAAEADDDAREVPRRDDMMAVSKSWWITLQGALDALAALTPRKEKDNG